MASEEDDDFAMYDPTTPAVKKVTKPSKTNGRSGAVAGPSSRPIPLELQEIRGDESDEGMTEVEAVQQRSKSKAGSKRSGSREPHNTAKPKPIQRSKGKGKARSPSPVEVIVNDEPLEMEEEEDIIQPVQATAFILSHNRRLKDEKSASWKKREERHRKELERLKNQLEAFKAQRDNLAKQLEETFHRRNTEAEDNLKYHQMAFETRLQTQEEMIKELTSQLARVDNLTVEGKTSTLHLITQETADEERRGVERQNEALKQALRERDQEIQKRDMTIQEHTSEIHNLQRELKAEIERSKTLVSAQQRSFTKDRTPNPNRSFGQSATEGVKASMTHRMYEDLTNLLITDCKCEITDGEETYVFKCLYSPNNSPADGFSFFLRSYHEPAEDGSGNVEKVAYSIIDNGQALPQFLDSLEHMQGDFTFHRDQLDAFLYQILEARYSATTEGD